MNRDCFYTCLKYTQKVYVSLLVLIIIFKQSVVFRVRRESEILACLSLFFDVLSRNGWRYTYCTAAVQPRHPLRFRSVEEQRQRCLSRDRTEA